MLFADRVHQAAARAGASTSVLMFDIDGLARVNETSGHAAGDAVLRSMARRLEAAVPPGATVARVGADEFAVLLDADDDAQRWPRRRGCARRSPAATRPSTDTST